jgi:hypothetical protein
MDKVSVKLGLLPPSLSVTIDVPLSALVARRLRADVPRNDAVAAVGRTLQILFEDQYSDADAAGAWSRHYPAYLRSVYGDRIPSDVSIRDSITCSVWIALALRHFADFAKHEHLERAIANRLAAFNSYLSRHFNPDVGAFGLTSKPSSAGTSEVVGDLRHTAWAVEWLATAGPNDADAQDRLRRSATWVHSQIDHLRTTDDRAVTHAVLHRLLLSNPSGSLVLPSERARKAAVKRLESRIVESYDWVAASWDMSLDPPAAATRNALFVLYCMPQASCVDSECKAVLADALSKMRRFVGGLPLVDTSHPDPGATCTLAYLLERDGAEVSIPSRDVVHAIRSAVQLVVTSSQEMLGHPWQLASLLLLAENL